MKFDITRANLAAKRNNIRVDSSRYDNCTSYTRIRKGKGKTNIRIQSTHVANNFKGMHSIFKREIA